MKLVLFDDFKLGVLKDGSVFDAMSAVSDIPRLHPQDLMNGLIARFADYRGKLDALTKGKGVPVGQVKLRAPLPRPATIDCMAVNYMEDGTKTEAPLINAFHKSPSSVIGDGETMILPDVPATVFEGEAELAVVIGKPASHVKAADAMGHIFGYMNFIDGSARNLPPPLGVFFQSKSRDTFAPMGPCIVTADEIPDPMNLALRTRVNGEVRQDSNTANMIWPIPKLIAYLSQMTLEAGDIILTGTPSGVAMGHKGGDWFLKDGDVLESELEGIGTMRNRILDAPDAATSWNWKR